jgi:hypothetical protein
MWYFKSATRDCLGGSSGLRVPVRPRVNWRVTRTRATGRIQQRVRMRVGVGLPAGDPWWSLCRTYEKRLVTDAYPIYAGKLSRKMGKTKPQNLSHSVEQRCVPTEISFETKKVWSCQVDCLILEYIRFEFDEWNSAILLAAPHLWAYKTYISIQILVVAGLLYLNKKIFIEPLPVLWHFWCWIHTVCTCMEATPPTPWNICCLIFRQRNHCDHDRCLNRQQDVFSFCQYQGISTRWSISNPVINGSQAILADIQAHNFFFWISFRCATIFSRQRPNRDRDGAKNKTQQLWRLLPYRYVIVACWI